MGPNLGSQGHRDARTFVSVLLHSVFWRQTDIPGLTVEASGKENLLEPLVPTSEQIASICYTSVSLISHKFNSTIWCTYYKRSNRVPPIIRKVKHPLTSRSSPSVYLSKLSHIIRCCSQTQEPRIGDTIKPLRDNSRSRWLYPLVSPTRPHLRGMLQISVSIFHSSRNFFHLFTDNITIPIENFRTLRNSMRRVHWILHRRPPPTPRRRSNSKT